MINFNGIYTRKQFAENGSPEVIFTVNGGLSSTIINDLEKGKQYRLQLTEIKSKRTIQQNNLMWKLLEEVAQKTGNEAWDVYVHALELAGAKYEYVACLPEAEETMKKAFRCVKLMNTFQHNGKTFNQYKAFIGSSKMNTREMAQLLDTVIKIAAENEIYIEETEVY